MLSKPHAGWTQVTIGDFSEPASYLTDVPVDFLKAMIHFYQHPAQPATVFLDSEGYEQLVVIDHHYTHIISENEDFDLKTIETKRHDLAKQLVSDISDNIDGWVNWDLIEEDESKLREERKELLITLCNRLDEERIAHTC